MLKLKNQSGFTIIEMIVSLLVIAALLSLTLVNYRASNKKSELTNAAQKFASDIRVAQNNTLGSKKFNGAIPKGGWGVHLDKSGGNNTKYIIFADIVSGDPNNGNELYDNSTEIWQTVILPAGVTIGDISVGNLADIVFLQPDPLTYINALNSGDVVITLKNDFGDIKTIRVNFLGLIDVEQ